jgi:hypothetical protein
MRAKFYCEKVSNDVYGQDVTLRTLYSDNPEDNQFSKATPSGELQMRIDNPNAIGKLIPGNHYYLDITEAPENK